MNPRHLISAALCLLLACLANAQKTRDAGASAPPPVVHQNVSVLQGETIAIPLAIHGVRGERLQFLIRTPPRHGRLSAVTTRNLNEAVVNYTASAKAGGIEDRFTYAASGSEGVSAPGVVTITILEPAMLPGKLIAPAELEFPPLVTGERGTVELEIGNRGRGVLEGDAKAPEPWTIEGSGHFLIQPGDRVRMTVVLQTEKAGKLDGDIVLSGAERSIVTLRALVEERFSVSPTRLNLAVQQSSRTRMGILRVSNRSREPAQVRLAAGPRLLTDRSVVIPARSDVEIPIFAEAGDVAAIDEKVTLSSGKWSASIPIHASAVGAVLRFASGGPVFGKVTPGEAADGVLQLENLGGEDASVRLDVGPPFQLRSQTVIVPAEGSLMIPVRLPSAEAGVHQATLFARGGGQVAQIEISAEVPAGPGAPVPRMLVATPVQAVPAAESPEASPEAPLVDKAIYPATLKEFPNGIGKFAREIQPAAAVLEWPASLSGTAPLRIEERKLALSPEGGLQITWERFDSVRISQAGNQMRAELTELEPASLHTMRVVAGGAEFPGVVFTAEFWTPPKKPFFEPNWRAIGLFAAIAVFLFLLWKRRGTGGGW